MGSFERLLNGFGSEEPISETELSLPSNSGGSIEEFIQKHANVTEEYLFYNGTVALRYNKEEHRYFRTAELGNLIPIYGVTTCTGIIDKSNALTPWAAKVTIAKLLRLIPTELVEGVLRIKPMTFEEFTALAMVAKTAHKDKLEEATDIGHLAHSCLEDSINFALQHDPEHIVRTLINLPKDEQACSAAQAGHLWMRKHNVRWISTESKIYSQEYDYAGTMDGEALCDSCDDLACCPIPFKDRDSLIDWKSSNILKVDYIFQTAGYKHAREEEFPEKPIEDIWINRLGKNEEEAGKFTPWHKTAADYKEDFQGFLACLNLIRLVDSVEDRMSQRRHDIRAIKKEQKETAKALAKEQEKLQKALDKAEAKRLKQIEKERIKEEAKAAREKIKAEAKAKREAEKTIRKKDVPAITDQQVVMCNVPVEVEPTQSASEPTQSASEPEKKARIPVAPPVPLEEALVNTKADMRLAGLPEPTVHILPVEEKKPVTRTFTLPMEKK
jgi:hypothetical protein